ncbi:unnamed protein product [Penicillium glandicola]
MPERKQTIRSGKAPIAPVSNGFTTERSVDGERRSIRHYHDGRVSQREGPVGPARELTRSNVVSRASSIRAVPSTMDVRTIKVVPTTKAAPTATAVPSFTVPRREDLRCDSETADEIIQLCEQLPSQTETPQAVIPQTEAAESWSSDSSYGILTPPSVASPELMSTEFSPPVAAQPDASGRDSNSISEQWADLGGRDRTGRSDIHN